MLILNKHIYNSSVQSYSLMSANTKTSPEQSNDINSHVSITRRYLARECFIEADNRYKQQSAVKAAICKRWQS